jgi:hypothetical protein
LSCTRREQEEAYHDGVTAGRSWVDEGAEYQELNRLARYRDSVDSLDFRSDAMPNCSRAMELYFILVPEGDQDAAREFLKAAVGEDEKRVDDGRFIQGFAEGAPERWNELRARL